MKYITPGGNSPKVYTDLINAPHLLIAGATGSGKSVLINSLISRILMTNSPATAQFILIDPKKVELSAYKKLPHTIKYADTPAKTISALEWAIDEMEYRYKILQKQGKKKTDAQAIYIFIDEYADLIVTHKKAVEPLVTRLIQLGRAANIHLIIATQRPTRDIITGTVKVNLDCKIALHTATAQDSRNIIGINGAEMLPRYGYCIISSPDGIYKSQIPMLNETSLIQYWTSRKCRI